MKSLWNNYEISGPQEITGIEIYLYLQAFLGLFAGIIFLTFPYHLPIGQQICQRNGQQIVSKRP